jgi:hypothetical protein
MMIEEAVRASDTVPMTYSVQSGIFQIPGRITVIALR